MERGHAPESKGNSRPVRDHPTHLCAHIVHDPWGREPRADANPNSPISVGQPSMDTGAPHHNWVGGGRSQGRREYADVCGKYAEVWRVCTPWCRVGVTRKRPTAMRGTYAGGKKRREVRYRWHKSTVEA